MFNTEKSKEESLKNVSGLMSGLSNAGISTAIGLGSNLINNLMYGSPAQQQKKLQDVQIKGAKELADYNNQKQLEMWKATNYSAQRAEMEKAGLSASLMFGGGGAGGGTTGSGGGGIPSGDTGSAQMMAKMQAQAINADTVLKLATADKTKAETDNLKEDNVNKSFDNEIRANIGSKEYSDQIKAVLNKERIENITDYRKAVGILDALGGTDPEKMYAVDKFGNYDNTEFSKLGKQQTKFMMDQYTELEAKINKLNQDIKASKQGVNESKANEELLKIEAEIRDFKADLSGLGLNETTTKIIELLLKGMLGFRGQNIMKNR